jgi:Rrf2 family cysteine metabolism transcriptional repressor
LRISQQSEYACLAMVALARLGPGDPPVRIREISQENEIPERYLVQILLRLKSAGLVASTRGSSGGYRLTRTPSSITIGEILNAIDGPETAHKDSRNPSANALADVWENVRLAERAVLDQTSIAQVAQRVTPVEWVI